MMAATSAAGSHRSVRFSGDRRRPLAFVCQRSALRAVRGKTLPPDGLSAVRCASETGYFTDPAMHRDCAEYALRVCPYLAMPKAHRSDLDKRPPPPGAVVEALVADDKPDRFMLGRSPSWFDFGGGLIKAAPWVELVWLERWSPAMKAVMDDNWWRRQRFARRAAQILFFLSAADVVWSATVFTRTNPNFVLAGVCMAVGFICAIVNLVIIRRLDCAESRVARPLR